MPNLPHFHVDRSGMNCEFRGSLKAGPARTDRRMAVTRPVNKSKYKTRRKALESFAWGQISSHSRVSVTYSSSKNLHIQQVDLQIRELAEQQEWHYGIKGMGNRQVVTEELLQCPGHPLSWNGAVQQHRWNPKHRQCLHTSELPWVTGLLSRHVFWRTIQGSWIWQMWNQNTVNLMHISKGAFLMSHWKKAKLQ